MLSRKRDDQRGANRLRMLDPSAPRNSVIECPPG
jgi:predicted protein tyrosine phosphatase